MYKIIELEIDPSLSADTGVFEVAWVEQPAIEQELMYFTEMKFFVAPEYVQKKACQAIKENEKRGNPAGTQVGKVRAQQLCKGENLSLETIKRMKSYLSRAATYDTGNWDDNGTIAMGLWGGKEALTWVDKILSMEENMGIQDFVDNADGFSVGDYVSWTYAGRGEGDDRARGQIKDLRVSGEVNIPDTDFTLTATEERPVALIETIDGSIVGQYVDNLRQIQKPENFVYPNVGETQDEFISRCVPVVLSEGKTEDQALGQCYGMWENREFGATDVTFDWDGTLNTPRGERALKQEISRGNRPHLIVERNNMSKGLIDFTLKYQIPSWRIHVVNNLPEKIETIKEIDPIRHYDDDIRVKGFLPEKWVNFDYELILPPYVGYPTSGDTDSMLIEPVLDPVLFSSCGCDKHEFGIQDFSIDIFGYETKHFDMCPVAVSLFQHLTTMTMDEDTIGMVRSAAQIADNVFEIEKNVVNGVETDDDLLNQAKILVDDFKDLMGEIDKEVGMVHDVSFMDGHISVISDYLNGYGEEEEDTLREAIETLSKHQAFERAPQVLQGLNLAQVKRAGFRDGQKLYRYTNFFPGILDSRDFCMSIEDNFFRRSIIDALRDYNTKFGHGPGGAPYSKWLYKGGPSCVHAWEEWVVTNRRTGSGDLIVDVIRVGVVPGTPGTPPRNLPNSGYFSPETEARSKRAYAIERSKAGFSQTYLNDQEFSSCFGGVCDVKFNEQKTQVFAADQDQRMIYTPLMIPNILIPRYDEVSKERYFVKFTPESIQRIRDKFMIQLRGRMTNYEHTDKKFEDIVMVESWIVEGENDKAYQLGFTKEQIPFGTWMGAYKVLDTPEGDTVWNEYIKPGKVKGASVEGNFILNFSQDKRDEYLLSSIINILKTIDE